MTFDDWWKDYWTSSSSGLDGAFKEVAKSAWDAHGENNLTFARMREANVSRAVAKWHSEEDWSPERWGMAFVGEVGETLEAVLAMMMRSGLAMNSLKKLIRGDGDPAHVAQEVADTFLYGDLLLNRIGISTEQAVRDTFNAKSREVESDVLL